MPILPPRVVTPGIYEARIVEAQIVSYHWRQSETNPRGLCLRVAVEVADDEGLAHLVDAIDISNRGRLEALFASCGAARPTSGEPDFEALVGCSCCISSKQITPREGSGAGRTKSVVGSWLLPAATRERA